ncbi:hypothetical protein A3D05_04575 [Candidatus Gottesmanbacteria bacterium RIFCSPHIGHO2_02_FULL_40_24]|uniref:Glycosyl transferase family 1 domain-containing protein n=1 Tax=Candidatus Gottesmanbacteria bacterium RIFCSPHIGHO2_01_FULL_40_15 TaxID=1798376 RepID=A0A1F5Z1Z2_9BACT|nr:MAG: hypothetical protein A2777_05605 [Candidatus Gottesmanbacteria bacterium RIFCSPHIGHO2_01_FULL_40_15]OGG16145.1 MAG: hypothetical protein A3D05_04575 [Candidatus Gottesmanbacteria bacterium RIFCSPHIGHO2_02_FULL_40_24]OGG21469.1 MAG: hypothetical protein A3B48_04580 [Candidatus Gottesmanbacteria bacterium RIFCSPLOWO2_01_FULL_40_10]OGG25815.1 MAG: hypothetical protein A3E42_05845 [Candidatus Gottesmanbacteria bacterium RIFCSPHIGHO2_12_FULL_40_13]
MKKKKILLYSPYLSTLGGGERYLFQIAAALQNDHRVTLAADPDIKKKADKFFSIDLNKTEIIPVKLFVSQKFISRYFFTKLYDLVFYVTDGSLIFPSAKKNYLIIQSPNHIPPDTFPVKLKLPGWKIVCYSAFMKNIISGRINRKAYVLPPAVDTVLFSQGNRKKEKIILTVGRIFTSALHEKRQDFLISFFKKNYRKHFSGWRFIICGNVTEESGQKTFEKMQINMKGAPVELHKNLPFSRLLTFYRKAAVYWHAAGYGSDEETNPEKMEHFGITTIEAMAAGAVPVVYGAGGQTEIIENGKSGFLFKDERIFLKRNIEIITNQNLLDKLKTGAVKKAAVYSFANFRKKVNELI